MPPAPINDSFFAKLTKKRCEFHDGYFVAGDDFNVVWDLSLNILNKHSYLIVWVYCIFQDLSIPLAVSINFSLQKTV